MFICVSDCYVHISYITVIPNLTKILISSIQYRIPETFLIQPVALAAFGHRRSCQRP